VKQEKVNPCKMFKVVGKGGDYVGENDSWVLKALEQDKKLKNIDIRKRKFYLICTNPAAQILKYNWERINCFILPGK
jgi:hypothetical protein